MARAFLASLLSLLFIGHAALPDDEIEVIDATLLQRFAMDPFESSTARNPIFYNDLSGILERFGEPLETVESKFPDRTSDATMTSYSLRFDGLEIAVIESEDKKHSWPDTITISGNAYPMKFGVRIGTAYGDLLELLQLEPPDYRAKSTRLDLHAYVNGYWPDFQDQSGKPKFVYGYLTVSVFFDSEDKIEKIMLWMSTH